jgi:hypothetical protein
VAEASQYQLFFVLFAALLIRVNVAGEDARSQDLFSGLLIVMNVFAPALAIAIEVGRARISSLGGGCCCGVMSDPAIPSQPVRSAH